MSDLSDTLLYAYWTVFRVLFSNAAITIWRKLTMSDINDHIAQTPIQCIVVAALWVSAVVVYKVRIFKSHPCLTPLYMKLLLMIMIIQIYLLVSQDVLSDYSKKIVVQLWEERSEEMKFWDSVHRDLQCCGLDTVSIWFPVPYPKSCCPKETQWCTIFSSYKPCERIYELVHGCSLMGEAGVLIIAAASFSKELLKLLTRRS